MAHPEDLEAERAERKRLIRGEARSYDLLMRLLRRDGQVVWVYANNSVVQDTAGTPLYFLVYIRDVTRAEASWRSSSARRRRWRRSASWRAAWRTTSTTS